jgi:hypothetical protein
LAADYRACWAQTAVAASELDRFLNEIEVVSDRAGISIKVGDDSGSTAWTQNRSNFQVDRRPSIETSVH